MNNVTRESMEYIAEELWNIANSSNLDYDGQIECMISYLEGEGIVDIVNEKENNHGTHSYSDIELYDSYVNLMDDEIREDVCMDLAPCTKEEFLEEYQKRHMKKYGCKLTI